MHGVDAWQGGSGRRVERLTEEWKLQNATLTQLRLTIGRFFVIGLWAHVPLIAAVGLLNGTSWVAGTLASMTAAGIVTTAWVHDREGPFARYVIAVAQIMMVSLLVWL